MYDVYARTDPKMARYASAPSVFGVV